MGKRMGVSDRQFVCIKTLLEQKGPIRGVRLHELCSQDILYAKESGSHFWRIDFYPMIKKLCNRGLVQRIELPNNQVWFAPTRQCAEVYLRVTNPEKAAKRAIERLQRALKITLYDPSEENRLELTKYAVEIPIPTLRQTIVYKLGEALGKSKYDMGQYPDDSYVKGRHDKLAKVLDDLMYNFDEKARPELLKDVNTVANLTFKRAHEEEVAYKAHIKMSVLGHCIFCNAEIHNADAAQDAKLLKKYTGKETGMVCCGCFRSLQWAERYLGGEKNAGVKVQEY